MTHTHIHTRTYIRATLMTSVFSKRICSGSGNSTNEGERVVVWGKADMGESSKDLPTPCPPFKPHSPTIRSPRCQLSEIRFWDTFVCPLGGVCRAQIFVWKNIRRKFLNRITDCMCMYVCMYVRMCVYQCVYIHTRARLYTFVRLHKRRVICYSQSSSRARLSITFPWQLLAGCCCVW